MKQQLQKLEVLQMGHSLNLAAAKELYAAFLHNALFGISCTCLLA